MVTRMIDNPSDHENETIQRIFQAMSHFYPSLLLQSSKSTLEQLIDCGINNGVYSEKHSQVKLNSLKLMKEKKLKRLDRFKNKKN